MKFTRTVVTFAVCIWLVCATLSVFARGTSAATDTKKTALLLGAASLDILFDRLAAQEQDGADTVPFTELPLRIAVDLYISDLELTNVRYPDDPVSSPENVAPLANYGQDVIDQLDSVHQAAFLVGWYGTILMRGDQNSNASNLVCGFAQDAGFSVKECAEDPNRFVADLLAKAKNPPQ